MGGLDTLLVKDDKYGGSNTLKQYRWSPLIVSLLPDNTSVVLTSNLLRKMSCPFTKTVLPLQHFCFGTLNRQDEEHDVHVCLSPHGFLRVTLRRALSFSDPTDLVSRFLCVHRFETL